MWFYGSSKYVANTHPSINTWTHLAFAHDTHSQKQLIYINGVLSCVNSQSETYVDFSDMFLFIGHLSQFNIYFNGLIDKLLLITRVNSPTEIEDDAALLIHYTFDANKFLNGSGRIKFVVYFLLFNCKLSFRPS